VYLLLILFFLFSYFSWILPIFDPFRSGGKVKTLFCLTSGFSADCSIGPWAMALGLGCPWSARADL
jgi:hypothetical protein